MSRQVVLLPGDGVGPELVEAAVRVIEAAGADLSWDWHMVGEPALRAQGEPLPAEVLDAIRSAGTALKGPVTTPVGRDGFRSVNIGLRAGLDLVAQVRLCRHLAGAAVGCPGTDIAVIRQTSEDLYSGIEFEPGDPRTAQLIRMMSADGHAAPTPGSALTIKALSEPAVRRVADFAFGYARATGRKRVTAVHKASAMRSTDGLFLEVARDVASANRDLAFDDCLIDTLCARLVRRPDDYDVLLTTAMYGDVLSDLAGSLAGGVGIVAGANYGEGVALFEAAHGSAPHHPHQELLDPIALVLSGALLLRHVGESAAASRIEEAVAAVVAEGRTLTYDLLPDGSPQPPATTRAITRAIVERLSCSG